IPLGHDDMVLEETVGEDDDGGGERVDSMVDAETDAAFAAILDDDALGGAGAAMAHAEPSPLPAPDDEAPAESLPPPAEAPGPEAPAPEAAAPAAPAAPREPAPAPPPGKPRLVEASPSADSLSLHGVVRDRQTGSYNTAPMPDLGLDEIAATETTTDHS